MVQKKKTNNKEKKQETIKTINPIKKEITGIITIAVGVLILFAIYTNNSSGFFGKVVSNFLSGMMGWTYLIFPFLIIVLGIYFIFTGITEKLKKKATYIIGLILLSSCFFHIAYLQNYPSVYENIKFFSFIGKLYNDGVALNGGGFIGGIIITPIKMIFGIAGSYTIAIAASIINLILLTNSSLKTFILNVKKYAVKFFNWMAESYKPVDEQLAEAENKMKRKKHSAKKETEEFEVETEDDFEERFNRENALRKSAEKQKQINFIVDGKRRKKPLEKIIDEKKKTKKTELENINDVTSKTSKTLSNVKQKSNNKYTTPPISLLNDVTSDGNAENNCMQIAKKLEETLASFGVIAKVVDFSRGPSVTRYELQPKVGVKVSKITALSDDIALNLASRDVRIEAPVPGKAVVGIEVPNKERNIVSFKSVIASKAFQQAKSPLAIAIGKDIGGNVTIADIKKMPHLLIAGATGSGKSVCVNTIIASVLYRSLPDEVKMIMIDPKKVELGMYNGIPHLLIPVVTNPNKAAGALNWAVVEMKSRYDKFSEIGARDIAAYNSKIKGMEDREKLPHILIIIDELADLMIACPGEVEDSICRLAQLARAAGMHLIIATQRPSVNVITGLIKANIPSRIAFSVVSYVDSRTIIDMAGAEKLLGKGDMLYHPIGMSKPLRVQGAFVADDEITRVVEYIKNQNTPEYDTQVLDEINSSGTKKKGGNSPSTEVDEYLPQAVDMIIAAKQASVSYVQRKFKVGYARAARMIDQMEERGIVGPFEGSKPRQVMITKDEWEQMKINNPEYEQN